MLSGVVATLALPFAGCAQPSGQQTLGFRTVDYIGTEAGNHRIRVTVSYGETDLSLEERGFHNVVLVAFNEGGDEVGRRALGDVPNETDAGSMVPLECRDFPETLTYQVQESMCPKKNEVFIAEYQGVEDGGHRWMETRERECDEPLPPGE